MYKIALSNEKGGVGKTSLSVNLAAGLANRGYRVMLVDCDPQGHAGLALGVKKEPGLYNLLVRGAGFNEVARVVSPEKFGISGEKLPVGQLYVIPSNIETRNIANSIEDIGIIGMRFEEVENSIDFVVFDTSPQPSLLHGTIYIAVDGIIYPTKPEVWAFDGLYEAMMHRKETDKKYRKAIYNLPTIKVMGVVPTMVKPNTLEHQQNIANLKKSFGEVVWNPINERIIWSEAGKYQCPVFALDNNNHASGDVWEMCDRVEAIVNV